MLLLLLLFLRCLWKLKEASSLGKCVQSSSQLLLSSTEVFYLPFENHDGEKAHVFVSSPACRKSAIRCLAFRLRLMV